MAETLAKVPSYGAVNHDTLAAMANFCRRVWLPAGARLLPVGVPPDTVYYIVAGLLRMVEGLGRSDERVLNIAGPGNCVGDWAAANSQAPSTTCVVHTAAELLVINGFNFRATADPAMLTALHQDKNEVEALQRTSTGRGDAIGSVAARAKARGGGAGSFKLISRRSVKEAVGVMVHSNDELNSSNVRADQAEHHFLVYLVAV